MNKLSFARAARQIVVEYLNQAEDPSALIEIESVATAGYLPERHMLHEGRVSRLAPRICDLTKYVRDEMELRSALVAIAGMDQAQSKKLNLSAKEILYLDMICDGLTDIEAAKKLSISLRAIKARKKVICERTQSATINQAIAKYVKSPKTRLAQTPKRLRKPAQFKHKEIETQMDFGRDASQ